MAKKLNYLMILTSCIAMVSCGSSDKESDLSIVGGRTVNANDLFARHVVSLISVSGQHFCTGSLVGKQLVLTAAHCVKDSGKFVIGFGPTADPRKMNKKYLRSVTSVAMNREYVHLEGVTNQQELNEKGKAISDVAFIKMNAPAPEGFMPVKLLPPHWRMKKGMPIIMAGYGVTATPKPGVRITKAEELLDSKNILDDNGTLRTVGTFYAGQNKLGEIVLMSKGNRGACSGDSGGPAFVPVKSPKSGKTLFYQVGVAARSNCYNSASYTDTRVHSEWIKRANRFVNNRK